MILPKHNAKRVIKEWLNINILVSELGNYEYDTKDLICLGFCSIIGVWYLIKRVRFYAFDLCYEYVINIQIVSFILLNIWLILFLNTCWTIVILYFLFLIALDCKQHIWTCICSEWGRVLAVEQDQHGLYIARRTLPLRHFLGIFYSLWCCFILTHYNWAIWLSW